MFEVGIEIFEVVNKYSWSMQLTLKLLHRRKPTPKGICDRLVKLYDQSAAGLQMQLKGELSKLKYSDFKDANEFVR
jgi:hypothetical protein